jgi:hypothetical protein
MPDDTNPLGIIMHDAGDGPEGYLPLRHVPEEWLEQKRAELLEFNSAQGLRKLTDEERARMEAEEPPPEPQEPEWSEPPDLMPGEGFG